MLTGRKLLLADDSVTIQKVVDLTFGDEGMQVTTVSDGEQALAKLEEINPDIVLADIHMPKLGGYDVCERIKHDERFRHLPVMLLVGSFEPFDEEEARRVGADDHLTKPFQSIRQLVNKVSALLGGGTPQEEAATQRLPSQAEMEERTVQEAKAHEDVMSAEALEVATANTAPLPPQPQSEAQYLDQNEHFTAADAGYDERAFETAPQAPEDEARQPFNLEESHAPAYAPAGVSPRLNFGARTEDALLDLGDIEPAYSTSEEDDFILDLQDESFYKKPQPLVANEVEEMTAPAESEDASLPVQLEEEMIEASPRVGEFTEAQFAGEEQRAEFAPTEEALEPAHVSAAPLMFEAESASVAAPLTQDASTGAGDVPVVQEAPPATTPGGQISLDQLSPEVIDAIARRAVEHLSERVVQEIAWEVVPQLAELLIKRRLEEERTQAK